MLSDALQLVRSGIGVIPTYDRKRIDICGLKARGYVNMSEAKKRLPTDADLRHWFANPTARRGLAIVCSSVVCLDFDTTEAYENFADQYPLFTHTWTVKTPRGRHLHYRVANEVAEPVQVTLPNIELKRCGSVVATIGQGYQTVSSGILDERAALKIRDIFVLPVIEKVEPKACKEVKPFFYTELNPSHKDPISVIKDSIPISQYLEGLGHTLIPGQYMLSCLCPLPGHEDRNPSFWIWDTRQLCGCHACGDKRRPMDIINLHMALNGCDIKTAIRDLLRRCNNE